MSSSSRVSIPSSVQKTIQNIREIAGNHSDEEIYAMLKECSMDPNETTQKLLLQDTFHEVKRKRDKKKENPNNKDSADSRWRSGTQGRGGRGGRGNHSPRYVTHDAGGSRNASGGKENGVNQMLERGVISSLVPVSKEIGSKATTPLSRSSATAMANGPTNVTHGSDPCVSELLAGTGTNPPEEPSAVDMNKLESAPALLPPVNSKISSPGVGIKQGQPMSSLDNLASPVSVLGIYSSASDPVLVPSLDSRLLGTVGTIKRGVGSQRATIESTSLTSVESESAAALDFTNHVQTSKSVSEDITEKAASDVGDSLVQGKMPGKSLGVERNQLADTSQTPFTSVHGGTMSSRSPSNYGSRSQQLIGSQKAVGPSKEWKPKPMNPSSAPSSGTVPTSDTSSTAVEGGAHSLPASTASAPEKATSKLQKKLGELHFSDNQHVIIPNHLQVPEAERTGLSFGSFDASFGVGTTYASRLDTDKSSAPVSESSHMIEESAEEPCTSSRNASPTAHEGDYPDHPQSPTKVQENLSPVEMDGPSNAVPEYDQTKLDSVLPVGGPQYSVVQTAPNYSTFGLMPPILGTQFAPFDSSEPQARDVSRLPGFVVQQPFDPSSSYFPQFYRPSGEGDGRFSPFLAPAAATKYNGNVAVLSPQSGQSPQEGGNSLVISTAGPTPLVTQAAGVMQSSIAVTQQSVPVFRQPAGVHLPHYPPNYMPYSQYFSPFYVPPPAIHHFLSNTPFPQQPPTGNIYPPSAAAAASTGVKYPLSQYKPGNTGSSTHVAMPTSYAPYSSSPAGYSPNPAATTGNSTGNEDLSASQYKENNVYITGQQSEGSTVWIPAPNREISGLQTSSFYNLTPQGQHVTFTPTQAGHGAFTGIYHPAQTVAAATVHPLLQQSQTMAGAVEMVGPPSGVYQQPQRAQINWTNNY